MSGQLLVIHVPRQIMLDAVEGIVPPSFKTIVFSQWSEDKDSMLIGFAEGPPEVEDAIVPESELN